MDDAPGGRGNLANASRSKHMMVHKVAKAFHLVPNYASEPHYTAVKPMDLWETVAHFNRTLNRNYPAEYIQSAICIPLWAAGVYK